MTLEHLGYNPELEKYRIKQNLNNFSVGRVISEHKDRYIIKTTEKEYEGEITGTMRFTAIKRTDFPAVGDWVAISEYDNKVLIHDVFPRKTIIDRQSVGKPGEKQIIATNIDYGLIVLAVDRDFNINRIERYLTICNSSGVIPVIILNKIDLVSSTGLASMIHEVEKRINDVKILAISNELDKGIDAVRKLIKKGKTYCLLGSSGVGKSTLLNHLLGRTAMKTDAISNSSNRGKHVTTHRELHVLEEGGIIIDNPGMREIGITDSTGGLEVTFRTIVHLSENCKYRDCTHTTESGCAVIVGVEEGKLDRASYENYLKLEREKEHFESTLAEKRKKDKDFGKMLRNYKKSNYKKF